VNHPESAILGFEKNELAGLDSTGFELIVIDFRSLHVVPEGRLMMIASGSPTKREQWATNARSPPIPEFMEWSCASRLSREPPEETLI
jgi:hypothetical protein